MENGTKKRKVFIITFILILLVLFLGYYLIKNRDRLFGTNGTLISNKIFAPLLGTSKNKDLNVIDTSNVATQGVDNNKDGVIDSFDYQDNNLDGKIDNFDYFDYNNDGMINEFDYIDYNNDGKINEFDYIDYNKDGSINEFDYIDYNNDGKIDGTDYEDFGDVDFPPFKPFNPPIYGGNNKCANGADNPTLCTTLGGKCINKATNPPVCSTSSDGACRNGADNPPACTTIGGKCLNNMTNPPLCTTDGGVCKNGADNPTLCTTLNGLCLNGELNPPECAPTDGGDPIDGKKIEDPTYCKVIDANPLTFTEAENLELADLLRRFYLIASSLKTEEDITLVYTEVNQYKHFLENVKSLTLDCKKQKADPSYEGPQTVYGNPWYHYTERGSYLPSDVKIESLCNYCETGKHWKSVDFACGANYAENPFCEPNGKDTRTLWDADRYWNYYRVPIFGKSEMVVGGTTYTGFMSKVIDNFVDKKEIYKWKNTGVALPVDLKEFEKVLNIW